MDSPVRFSWLRGFVSALMLAGASLLSACGGGGGSNGSGSSAELEVGNTTGFATVLSAVPAASSPGTAAHSQDHVTAGSFTICRKKTKRRSRFISTILGVNGFKRNFRESFSFPVLRAEARPVLLSYFLLLNCLVSHPELLPTSAAGSSPRRVW